MEEEDVFIGENEQIAMKKISNIEENLLQSEFSKVFYKYFFYFHINDL